MSYYAATGNLNPEGDVQINQPFEASGTARLFSSTWLSGFESFSTLFHQDPFSNQEVTDLGRGEPPFAMFTPQDGPILSSSSERNLDWFPVSAVVSLWVYVRPLNQVLTESTPHLGYFLAGGMAGVVSRTATAPLDRLKVYLIAQTSIRNTATNVAKASSVIEATKLLTSPLVDSTKELWRAGGIRSLFAGLFSPARVDAFVSG